ncbi:MAG TPA: hypothetical protein VD731_00275 [Nitrosopumilaceae archaeon]|nr:hypothetical protein [Nitrosopumilaceae archaeon]
MKLEIHVYLLISILLVFYLPLAEAETIKQTMEGSLDVQIIYPESVVIGRTFSVSILLENNGWEDKQNISLSISNPDGTIIPTENNEMKIDRLSTKGSYGRTLDFKILPDASIGKHFLNLLYSQVLVKNNVEPQNPTTNNIAIPITIKNQPKVIIHTITPEAIFPNAEFPFEIEIISQDIDITKLTVQIIPPESIEFLGEVTHSFSTVQKNIPISIISQIKTPQQELATEHKIPFEVIASYTDDIGNEKIDSETVQLVLRPRTLMEITTDGGIWIGDFFIAPYVSIGTIIAIPAGTLFSLAIKRSMKKKKKILRKK